jgi:elongation factor Ts
MISAQQIKILRDKTGAGISDIKSALEEVGGDIGKAEAIIAEHLGARAGKRSGRETGAGVVDAYIHSNGRIGALAELLCETDFVARNPVFRGLTHDIAMQIAAMAPTDKEALLSSPFIKDGAKTVADLIQ